MANRYLPGHAFPPYTYVPRRSPHPLNDPAGHLYGRRETAVVPLDPGRPQTSLPWLRAIDLFNAGYYWEAHEEWESLWHAAGRRGRLADLLKGLIKLAAAGVQAYAERPEGVRRHAVRAAELLTAVSESTPEVSRWCGLDLKDVRRMAESIAVAPERLAEPVAPPPCPALLGELVLHGCDPDNQRHGSGIRT